MPRQVITCCQCGAAFTAWPSRRQIYCSRACRNLADTIPLEVRFAAYVGATTEKGCILWSGCVNEHGYGVISARTLRGQNILAHRLAWELAHGRDPGELDVLHSCDNPPCINPEHLFTGTHVVNMADKVSKGRQPRGEQMPRATFTDEDALAIRAKHAEGGLSQRQIARLFGTRQQTVQRILARKTWKHI